ncbi:penicillin-binding protein 1A [Candidatus Endowatersipora endosymbiont of Watersipora subatra]|uniref:penicillin-binding protein 1A n=1 Tax=Candidatus Endowatersipora endosymbiont of Watersipora subatra TaxID=3077946 RepID=UPI00312CBFDC
MFLRFLGHMIGIGILGISLIFGSLFFYIREISKELPDYDILNHYEPPVTTRIYSSNGSLMAEYARERRLYLPIDAVPSIVKQAFISAEDKNFYNHIGIDFLALGKATFDWLKAKISRRVARARGASTITQQVAKNFLLTSDRTVDRKIKEAILALRIESTYSKEKILELYLNEIPFGLGSYGVAGAALRYFNKSVHELELHEIAYLAGLPKGPNNYHPYKKTNAALKRRNWVINRMFVNGYITVKKAKKAKAMDLSVHLRKRGNYLTASEYFSEEVRRDIINRYGKKQLYEGGLSIRTTLNPKLQTLAKTALKAGLINYDRKRGYYGAYQKIGLGKDWGIQLAKINKLSDLPEWLLAVVLKSDDTSAKIGIQPNRLTDGKIAKKRIISTLQLSDMAWAKKNTQRKGKKKRRSWIAKHVSDFLFPGDVVWVSPKDNGGYKLEQIPEVSGAVVAMDPHTGRVLAMVGGFSFSLSQFNRATQAQRQPGSSFKPFVYAVALDNGYTPSSIILDAPFVRDQGGALGSWEPKNYGGKYAGPSTLRLGIEKSRNLMTVRLANDMGMPLISEYSKRFGIYDKDIRGLAASLGSRETTVIRMVSAYSVLANGGKKIYPSMIDRIQNRYGKTIYRHEKRSCKTCNFDSWNHQDEPELIDERDQILDPMTAYQITSMMEGVVLRGTARRVQSLGVPIAGKTGTTNEERDAWFVGYSPDLVVGVYVGYDQPEPMGHGNTGGRLATPIFVDFMTSALSRNVVIDFRVPEGIKLYPINPKTGLLAELGASDVIMEAFKPGTAPPHEGHSIIGLKSDLLYQEWMTISDAEKAVLSGTGGLY